MKIIHDTMYRYSEQQILEDIRSHIDSTYEQHYQSKSLQLIDLFESEGMIVEYLKTSIMRYVVRYGKKDGFKVLDLIKAIHCIILLIHFTKPSNIQLQQQVLSESKNENI
jgi:hypothetical protein